MSTTRSRAKVRTKPPRPAVPPILKAPKWARIAVVINEAASRVNISSRSNVDADHEYVTTRQNSSFGRMLPPGRYDLTVKKAGYFDEARSIELAPGVHRKLVVSLRPQMSILTLKTNLADAAIEIEKAGRFTGSVKKHFLNPGKYRISLNRRGFLSQTITADLTIAGKEQNIYVVLQPLRIDSVLAQSNELLSKGDLNGAGVLVNDVLMMNPAHARANLLYGSIEFRRGKLASSGYFLKAIKGGETVSIPVKTVIGTELIDVHIALDRDAIAFRSSKRVDLNFRITRSNLEAMQRLIDGSSVTYIAVRGDSDFFGRDIHPNLKIVSSGSGMDPASKQVFCPAVSGGRSCAVDIDILFDVISKWRNMSAVSAKGTDR